MPFAVVECSQDIEVTEEFTDIIQSACQVAWVSMGGCFHEDDVGGFVTIRRDRRKAIAVKFYYVASENEPEFQENLVNMLTSKVDVLFLPHLEEEQGVIVTIVAIPVPLVQWFDDPNWAR